MMVNTPKPPYYAVIFSSITHDVVDGYKETADLMIQLASQQKGFLGVESAREVLGITVSYWQDEASIREWKAHAAHLVAQKRGKQEWYKKYQVRVAKVERDYAL